MSRTKEVVMKEIAAAQSIKKELEAKVKGGDTTEKTRKELTDIDAKLMDLSAEMKKVISGNQQGPAATTGTEGGSNEEDEDEEVVEKPKTLKKLAEEYQPAKGTENMVHAFLQKGKRFNPNTGEEASKPFAQIFSPQEWVGFEKMAKSLGYTFEIAHKPKK